MAEASRWSSTSCSHLGSRECAVWHGTRARVLCCTMLCCAVLCCVRLNSILPRWHWCHRSMTTMLPMASATSVSPTLATMRQLCSTMPPLCGARQSANGSWYATTRKTHWQSRLLQLPLLFSLYVTSVLVDCACVCVAGYLGSPAVWRRVSCCQRHVGVPGDSAATGCVFAGSQQPRVPACHAACSGMFLLPPVAS